MTDPHAPRPLGQPAAQVQVLRVLALTFTTFPLLLGAVVWFTVPAATEDLPVWIVAVVIALVVVGWVSAQTVGFQAEPLTQGDGPTAALDQFRTALFLRFALTEMPIIVGMALTFVFPHGPWTFAVALLLGLPALVHQTWPSRRVVTRYAARLESRGVPSGLLDAFGMR